MQESAFISRDELDSIYESLAGDHKTALRAHLRSLAKENDALRDRLIAMRFVPKVAQDRIDALELELADVRSSSLSEHTSGYSREWERGYDEGFYAHRDNTRKEMLRAIDNIFGKEGER